jgi:hypothetical protein
MRPPKATFLDASAQGCSAMSGKYQEELRQSAHIRE